jgi:hypothetical protein
MSRQFSAKPGPVTLAVDAEVLWLEVTADRSVRTATAEVTGPAEVAEKASAKMEGGTWTLTLPRTGRRQGGISIVSYGGGSSVITGGDFYDSVMQVGGRIVINGVDVTQAVRAGTPEPLRAVVRLPAGSSLTACVDSGAVIAAGALDRADAETVSAGIRVEEVREFCGRSISGDVAAEMVTGSAMLRATSGDISLIAAGPVEAESVSGDIRVHLTRQAIVRARSVSGDIRVTADSGIRPDVRARSVSGRVRTC